MRITTMLGITATAVSLLASGAANATNTCQADTLSCATTMPVGGYCECHVKGDTKSGTVVAKPEKGEKDNSTAGGCGVHPDAPGCK